MPDAPDVKPASDDATPDDPTKIRLRLNMEEVHVSAVLERDDEGTAYDATRARHVRQSYINHRMMDLPAVYQNLLPASYDVMELWDAERAIRQTVDNDQKLLAQPWRKVGPPISMGDFSRFKGMDRLTFGLDVSIPDGLDDMAKRGHEHIYDEPDIRAKLDAAAADWDAKDAGWHGLKLAQVENGPAEGTDPPHNVHAEPND